MLRASAISYSYGSMLAVDRVDLTARPGRVLGVIGPNGSGKSTVLRCLFHGLTPDSGEVSIEGRPLSSLSARDIARLLAVVVQENVGESTLDVAEMVLLGRTVRLSGFRSTTAADHEAAAEALERVGATHLAQRPLAELSGGEKQRVLIARALAQGTSYLLLDEPTNHLDIRYQHEVLALLRGLAGDLGAAVVVVLHDLNLAAAYCDDLVLLEQGRMVAQGTVDEVLDPAVVQRVYGIATERLDRDGELHLLFRSVGAASTAGDLS
ncbi:ABC transporter ATP-binding protein [Marihabitans asiaticum]|uniref:Iron complex transport system ATP-binding protein n=1 Tax=Marihabitans asiaticum TaxID=415218 RepID=A0A560WE58_9MICO|nr:ABC transporter ATP-binding protein [Marihabitans asiaticum]TWD15947.1 iron complex transport system ATP-binding protein [Marihabitans asiaticum]